jgi:ribonuclease D
VSSHTPSEVIRDPGGVAAVVAAAHEHGRIALDFEFLWERTYAPRACLAQVAIDGRVHLIDPIEGAPLDPIAALVADPAVDVVMHAPSSDLTLLGMQFGTRPSSILDVQLAAGFIGIGAGQGLGVLLDRGLKIRLDKGEQYTDWSRRPLTDRQLTYAAADVAHLIRLADEFMVRAERLGRTAWIAEEMERRYGPGSRWVPDPDEVWRRVKGQGKLSPGDRAVLRALAAWREREAARRDRPTAWIVPDRTLLEIARRRPASVAQLAAERGLPERMRQSDLDGILSAIADGAAAPPIQLPPAPPADLQARMDTLGPLGQILVTSRAAEAEVAPSLVATRDEIETFLWGELGARDASESPLASGWRFEIAGRPLRDLAEGRIALVPSPERPFLREIPRDPDR